VYEKLGASYQPSTKRENFYLKSAKEVAKRTSTVNILTFLK